MGTYEFELGKVVVKIGGLPGLWSVTCSTVVAKFTFMRVVLFMAGEAILWRRLQI
jgi:hypothetical protein